MEAKVTKPVLKPHAKSSFVGPSAFIARKVTPPAVKIKLVTCARIDDVKIFTINVIDLDQAEELYKDLVSYKIMNERYKIE